MVNDVIKNFLIKFKVDDKELKKATDSNNILKQMGGGNPQTLIRTMDKLQKDLRQVFTKDMPKAFGDMGKVVDKLREQHFKKTKDDLEKLGRVLEERVKRLDSAKTPEDRLRAQQKLNNTYDLIGMKAGSLDQMSLMNRRASGLPGMFGMSAGQAMKMGNIMGGAGAAAMGVATAANFVNSARIANLQNLTVSQSPFMERRKQFAQGNFEDAVMEALETAHTRARGFARNSRNINDITQGAKGVGGLLLATGLIGATGGTGAAVLGAGGLSGLIGGAGLYSAGSSASYFSTRGGAAYEAQQYSNAFNNYKARSFNPFLYQQYRSTQDRDFLLKRQFGFNDTLYAMNRVDMINPLDPTGEIALGLMSANRSRIGSGESLFAAQSAARIAKSRGLSVSASGDMLANLRSSMGGSRSDTLNELQNTFKEAAARGVTDTGLSEMMANFAIAASQQSNAGIGSSAIMERIAGGFDASNPNSALAARNAMGAFQTESNRFNRGGLDTALRLSVIKDTLSKLGGNSRDNLLALAHLSEGEFLAGSDTIEAVAQKISAGNKNVSVDQAREALKNIGNIVPRVQRGARPDVMRAEDAFRKDQSKINASGLRVALRGANYSDNDISAIMASISNESKPLSAAQKDQIDQAAKSENVALTEGASQFTFASAFSNIRKKMESEKFFSIEQNKDAISSAIGTMNAEAVKETAGNSLEDTTTAFKGALDGLVDAISNATNKINSIGGGNSGNVVNGGKGSSYGIIMLNDSKQ